MATTPISLELPVLILAATTLLLAVGRDIYLHRIDNWITLPCALLAVWIYTAQAGWGGALNSLGGLLVGLLVFLPFYLRQGMAAGDVKLMAAIGACVGPYAAFWAAAYALVTGAFLAGIVILVRGGLSTSVQHLSRQLWAYSHTRVWVSARTGSILSQRFPYAMAIAGGYCLLLFVGVPGRG